MKAIQYKAFGKSDVLELAEVAKPAITSDNEVLIKVKTATINPFDIKVRSGFMQKMMPIQLPYVPGSDPAGIVEAVGAKVSHVKVGDEVMASSTGGAYAEYVVVKEDKVLVKPAAISFVEASSLVVPIGTAQSILFNEGKLAKGQRVFIQGASGAVGGIMIQMAKAVGAYVIGTTSGKGLDFIKSLGADEAIDYKGKDFTANIKDIDLVVDGAGGEAQPKLFEVLKKGGKLISIVMPPSAELAANYGVEAKFISSTINAKTIAPGLQLLKEGKLKPFVSKLFKLADAAEAQDYVSAGGVNGKVVLEVQ